MEIVIPTRSTMDIEFCSARTTPFSTAPSSPRRFGHFSAPTSPGRASEIYREIQNEVLAMIPFDWEETPGTPKSPKPKPATDDINDFAFEFSVDLENSSRSADELFDGGKIKPLKPPPGHVRNHTASVSSPRSPRSPKRIIQNVFSAKTKKSEEVRGRERFQDSSNGSSRRASRSLSPYRVSQFPWEEEKQVINTKPQPEPNQKTLNSTSSTSSKSGRKWSFKEFFLFRSASEGRASDKDPLKKYSSLFRKHEDVKNSSFRSTDSSNSGSVSKRRGPVSAHELHYTKNRAASEDMRKRTFLPYKQGILGRIGFNPLSSGFGTL